MSGSVPIYRDLLGEEFDALPPQIRAMHELTTSLRATGRADIERGRNKLAAFVAAIMGVPEAGRDVPLTVTFARQGATEIWRREFGRRVFKSVQFLGTGRHRGLLAERFGPFIYYMRVPADQHGLALIVVRHTCLGLPIPAWALPKVTATETVAGGRPRASVRGGHECARPSERRAIRLLGRLQRAPARTDIVRPHFLLRSLTAVLIRGGFHAHRSQAGT